MSNRRRLLVTSSTYNSPSVRLWLIWITTGSLLLAGSACGDTRQPAPPPTGQQADDWTVVERDPDAQWLPILATQDLAVGVKRVAFSLDGLGPSEEPPTVRVSLFELDVERSVPRSVQFARFIAYDPSVGVAAHGHANASVSDRSRPIGRGVFVVPVNFSSAGLWGLLLEMASDDARETVRLRFSVRARQAAPRVGEPAPAVESRTRADVSTLSELTSDPDPEPGLYAISIAEALNRGRPSIVAFATPAFCHSRTCAPVLDAVKAVWREFSSDVSGVHVEVFENPSEPARLVEAEAFTAWRLPSEPWVFVIDAGGVIRYAFEGAMTEEELRSAVEWVVQDGWD
ncbi:MAG: hypothetical protein OXI41_10685 [Chloroflexota bacterium]|nr:hypothetical protein [Chloroflexota bacterium]MDE2893989.1 hypothetical protein [Chloroflexota bacterium]